jgi:hypothetical protein
MALSDHARAAKLHLKSGNVHRLEVDRPGLFTVVPPSMQYGITIQYKGVRGITTDQWVAPGETFQFRVSRAEAEHLERVWKKQQKREQKQQKRG